jgi:3-oxoacyl-[acyl-carrier protein] reductase
MMEMHLTTPKRVALVTGGSRGIGKAICIKMASLGIDVVVNYKSNEKAALEVVDTISQTGIKALAIEADVSESSSVDRMFTRITDEWGKLDILVNNAGIINDSLLLRMSEDTWKDVINTNLNGTFYCSKAAMKSMVRNRWGRIINIVSVIGIEGNIGQANYAASKGAIISFSKSIAKEVASRNITVNAVAPGYIETDIVNSVSKEVKDIILSRIAQKRLGSAEEVASLVGFLASDEAGYITGEVIRIDGGIEL